MILISTALIMCIQGEHGDDGDAGLPGKAGLRGKAGGPGLPGEQGSIGPKVKKNVEYDEMKWGTKK